MAQKFYSRLRCFACGIPIEIKKLSKHEAQVSYLASVPDGDGAVSLRM